MVQRVQVILAEDLDGGPADQIAHFGLDGRDYEIDLSEANADKLREALDPFLTAGRKAPSRPTRAGVGRSTAQRKAEIPATRRWAQDNGYMVSDRGRIPQRVQDAYHAATTT